MGICLLVFQLPTARLMPENRAGSQGSSCPLRAPSSEVGLGNPGFWVENDQSWPSHLSCGQVSAGGEKALKSY